MIRTKKQSVFSLPTFVYVVTFSVLVNLIMFFYVVPWNSKGGDKLTLTIPESDRTAASPVPALRVDVVAPAVSPASNSASSEECPLTPVTMTHFQQSENGHLELKTVPESNNPFTKGSPSGGGGGGSAAVAPPLSSKNPFITDEQCGSNPFLLRMASPVLERTCSPPVVSEAPLSVEITVPPEPVSCNANGPMKEREYNRIFAECGFIHQFISFFFSVFICLS